MRESLSRSSPSVVAWAAEVRDERARPEAWLEREQWRSAQRALAAQGVELRKRTMPGMTPDAPTSE
jgi:hypothetical protein